MRYLAHIKSQDRKILLSSVRQRYCAHIYVYLSERERESGRAAESDRFKGKHTCRTITSHHITYSHYNGRESQPASQPLQLHFTLCHVFGQTTIFFWLYQTNHIADAMHLDTYTYIFVVLYSKYIHNSNNNNSISRKVNAFLGMVPFFSCFV